MTGARAVLASSTRSPHALPAHLPVLDGFRALAIVAVLLFHNFGVPGGWMGVDLFFVLSGFLITRILLGSKDRANYFRRFYLRRMLRIFPAYYALLLILAAVLPESRAHLVWYSLYLGDFTSLWPAREVVHLHHTWSLAVEEQFYLVWPLVIWLFSRRDLVRLCVGGLALGGVLRVVLLQQGLPVTFLNFNIVCRLDGLLAGALMAIAVHQGARPQPGNQRGAALVILLSTGVLVGLGATHRLSVSTAPNVPMETAGYLCIAMGGAAAIWWALGAGESGLVPAILTSRPLTWIGKISYGLYLFHYPILTALRAQVFPGTDLRSRLLLGATTTAVTFVVAALSWRFFEGPLNAVKDRWRLTAASTR